MRGLSILLMLLAPAAQALVLFEEAPRTTVCGPAWERSFETPAAVSATVEIKGLHGLTLEHKGGARLWLDRELLGPLRPDHLSGGWINPRPVALQPGKHTLSIECGGESFEIEGVVVRDARRATTTAAAKGPMAAASVQPRPAAQPALDCSPLKPNTAWPGDPRRSILLSVVSDRAASSGVLTTFKRGETLTWWFKISRLPETTGLEFPPIVMNQLRAPDGRCVLEIALDHGQIAKARKLFLRGLAFDPVGYIPKKWTPLRLDFCEDGRFGIDLNKGKVRSLIQIKDKEMSIELQSREIELEIKGKKP